MDIAKKVKELSKARGLTLAQLAAKMQVTPAGLSSIIHGNPTLTSLEEVASALQVPLNELFMEAQDALPVPLVECPYCRKRLRLSIAPDINCIE